MFTILKWRNLMRSFCFECSSYVLINKKGFLMFRVFLVSLCLNFLASSIARAQVSFPNKPVTIVVPLGAGGFSDTVARAIGLGLTAKWNVAVVIENKPGTGGLIGAAAVTRMPADGYTLFLANVSTNSIYPNLNKNLTLDVGDEFEAVIALVRTPNLISVGNNVPVKTVKELIDLAKIKQLDFGTPSIGSSGHLSAEMWAIRANVKFQHIPYKSSPQVLGDIINGNLQFTIDNILTWAPLAKNNRVRPIAVTSLRRSPLLPDVPTLDESGYPGYQATSWFGIAVLKNTPREIIAKLNADIGSVIETQEFRQKVVGAEVIGGTSEFFKNYINSERDQWGKVIRSINLTMD